MPLFEQNAKERLKTIVACKYSFVIKLKIGTSINTREK